MLHKTLAELQKMKSGDALPYPNALVKATVVKLGHTATFTNANGEKGSILNFSIADGTEAMIVTLSDEAKMPTIKEGRTLQIRNFIVKGSRPVLSKQSKIMAGPAVQVPEPLKEKAVTIIMPPSPTKTLKDAMSSPFREILTVQAQIIRDEAIKTVNVPQKDTKIRTLTLEENGQTMELTLWRELSENDLKIGQYIEVTHCLVSEWLRKKSLNSTRNTTIKTVQPKDMVVTGNCEALSMTDTHREMCVNEDDIYKDFIVDLDIIRAQVQRYVEEAGTFNLQQLENMIVDKLPFPVKLVVNGTIVISFELL